MTKLSYNPDIMSGVVKTEVDAVKKIVNGALGIALITSVPEGFSRSADISGTVSLLRLDRLLLTSYSGWLQSTKQKFQNIDDENDAETNLLEYLAVKKYERIV